MCEEGEVWVLAGANTLVVLCGLEKGHLQFLGTYVHDIMHRSYSGLNSRITLQ